MRANAAGETICSCRFQTNASRMRCVSVSSSTRMGMRVVGRQACFARASADLRGVETEGVKVTKDLRVLVPGRLHGF